MTSFPLEVSARLRADRERVPANWKMRSYFWPLWVKSSWVRIDGGCADAYQHFVIVHDGVIDLFELENIR
jgi:hypothetical protein